MKLNTVSLWGKKDKALIRFKEMTGGHKRLLQFHLANKFKICKEDKFLKVYNFLRLNQKEIENQQGY